jgi:hypothetical protein
MLISRARILPSLATAGTLLVAALCVAANAQAQARVDGKIVIFKAHHTLNPYYAAVGEAPAAAVVYDRPAFGCLPIPRQNIDFGGHNLLNLTSNAAVIGYTGSNCDGIPSPAVSLPIVAAPNQGIHVDFANSLRLVSPGAAGNILAGIGTGIANVVGLITGTSLETGPTPVPNASLYFMPTPDGQVSADRDPGSTCRSTNASVHMAYNASPKWMYTWIDPPVEVPFAGTVLGCTVGLAAIPPGSIQHLFLSANFSYSLSPVAPATAKATARVKAACHQHVSGSASRRARARARTQATNCEKSLMYAKARKAAMRHR